MTEQLNDNMAVAISRDFSSWASIVPSRSTKRNNGMQCNCLQGWLQHASTRELHTTCTPYVMVSMKCSPCCVPGTVCWESLHGVLLRRNSMQAEIVAARTPRRRRPFDFAEEQPSTKADHHICKRCTRAGIDYTVPDSVPGTRFVYHTLFLYHTSSGPSASRTPTT